MRDRGRALPPRVSVVVAVYNGEEFLPAAIESVLTQSFSDIELVVVDDGSSDGSGELLARVGDSRLQILRNERNLGFAAALNRGIRAARGSYIARLDADDICAPDRFARQVAFLEDHESVAIVGSAVTVAGQGVDDGTVWTPPRGSLAVRFAALLRSPFLHPTVMLRRGAFTEAELAYDGSFAPAEDYQLWSRLLRSADGANLPEPLVTYRLHGASMTSTRRGGMVEVHDTIACSVIAHELPDLQVASREITNMRRAFVGGEDGPFDRSSAVGSYLDLLEAFGRAHADDPELGAVKREAAVDAARVLLGSERRAASSGLWRRIVRIEPAIPLVAAREGVRRALRRRGRTR